MFFVLLLQSLFCYINRVFRHGGQVRDSQVQAFFAAFWRYHFSLLIVGILSIWNGLQNQDFNIFFLERRQFVWWWKIVLCNFLLLFRFVRLSTNDSLGFFSWSYNSLLYSLDGSRLDLRHCLFNLLRSLILYANLRLFHNYSLRMNRSICLGLL